MAGTVEVDVECLERWDVFEAPEDAAAAMLFPVAANKLDIAVEEAVMPEADSKMADVDVVVLLASAVAVPHGSSLVDLETDDLKFACWEKEIGFAVGQAEE